MGACTFTTVGRGKTVRHAYLEAVREAEIYSGTDPYNGTISTTDWFEFEGNKDPLDEKGIKEWYEDVFDRTDKRECKAIKVGRGKYLFAGWAAE